MCWCHNEAVVTAEGLSAAVAGALIEVTYVGEPRAISDVEFADTDPGAGVEPGDLVLAIGVTDADRLAELVTRAADGAGLVARLPLAGEQVVLDACRRHDVTMLGLQPGVAWSHAIWLIRGSLDRAVLPRGHAPHDDDVYTDLFAMADAVSAIIGAPVTIEDARSQVLSYSTGQERVDPARLSTIVGRKVPAPVMAHFRALGVYRKLARSDDPVFVPEGPGGVLPRFVVPVRAGSDWLGSIWAVVDEPVTGRRLRDLEMAADVLALHLLRLRAEANFTRQLVTERLRSLLLGATDATVPGLGNGPWRAVALAGPDVTQPPATRLLQWESVCRRHGWRGALLADVGSAVFAVTTADEDGPGGWPWLRELVEQEPSLSVAAGAVATEPAGLLASCAQAVEVAAANLPTRAVSFEDGWAAVTVRRAVGAVDPRTLPGPLQVLREHDTRNGTALVQTLAAVVSHWGQQKRAASVLGVHPNSVRYRLGRIADLVELDLDDPEQRLAIALQCAATS